MFRAIHVFLKHVIIPVPGRHALFITFLGIRRDESRPAHANSWQIPGQYIEPHEELLISSLAVPRVVDAIIDENNLRLEALDVPSDRLIPRVAATGDEQ